MNFQKLSLSILFLCCFHHLKSQSISCENLTRIINSIRLGSDSLKGKLILRDEAADRYTSKLKLDNNSVACFSGHDYLKNEHFYTEYFAEDISLDKADKLFSAYYHALQSCAQTAKLEMKNAFKTAKIASINLTGILLELKLETRDISGLMNQSEKTLLYNVFIEINYVGPDIYHKGPVFLEEKEK